jgi:hypothetical protein
MKTRYGFVSNSSSTSFTCDVCGTTESGMDASACDFEMTQCINGHCFCDCHAEKMPESTPESIRTSFTSQINDCSWSSKTDKERELQELADTKDEDLEDYFRENFSDDGVPECQCPICSFTALNDSDGYKYLKKKFKLTDENILAEMKADFKTYKELSKHLHGK